MILPYQAHPLLFVLGSAFTTPTFHRFTTLMVAAILTSGRRTIANLLRTLGALAPGHRTSYQRLFSQGQWSGLQLACLLTRLLLHQLLSQGTIRLVGDDTVDGHKGKKVHGKARPRDPVRSTKSYTALGCLGKEGRDDTGLIRHLILALVVLAFVATQTERLRGENPPVTAEQVCRALNQWCATLFGRRRGVPQVRHVSMVIRYHQRRNAQATKSHKKKRHKCGIKSCAVLLSDNRISITWRNRDSQVDQESCQDPDIYHLKHGWMDRNPEPRSVAFGS